MSADESGRAGSNQSGRRKEIDAAISDLNACIQRIHALIPRVHAVIDRRTEGGRPQARPRVVYGGGPSVFAPQRRPADEPPRRRVSRPMIVAADLALAGYSRGQIGARLQAWDEPGAAEALEGVFE